MRLRMNIPNSANTTVKPLVKDEIGTISPNPAVQSVTLEKYNPSTIELVSLPEKSWPIDTYTITPMRK